MKIKYRYIPQHKEKKYFLDQYAQPVEDYMKAIRFQSPDDDFALWLLGRFGPVDPFNYKAVPLKIIYELEVPADVQQE